MYTPTFAKRVEPQMAPQPFTPQAATRVTPTTVDPSAVSSTNIPTRDSILPTITPSKDTSPESWLTAHPWMQSAMSYMSKGGPVPAIGELFVNPLARELERPAVSTYRGITDTRGAVKTPFGDVEPYSGLSPGKAALGAVETALTVLPVEKVIAPIGKGVSKIAGKAAGAISSKLPSLAKVGETLSNVPAQSLERIAVPEVGAKVKAVRGMVDDKGAIADFGKSIYEAASGAYKKAIQEWEGKEMKILEKVGPKFKPGLAKVRDSITDIFEREGVKIGEGGVDVTGSKFSQNEAAQDAFQKVWNIVNEPLPSVAKLLDSREAITNLLSKDMKPNVGRVVKEATGVYDQLLDDVTEGGAAQLRKEYAKVVDPAKKVMKQMVTKADGRTTFSEDKAARFVEDAMSQVKFDRRELLSRLDKVAGTQFAQDAEAMGLAKAIQHIDPQTGGRVKDVITSLVISKVPILSALASPRLWGELMLAKGAKAAKSAPVVGEAVKAADSFKSLLLQNILAKPLIQAWVEAEQEDAAF
jgi:hypothetical protein